MSVKPIGKHETIVSIMIDDFLELVSKDPELIFSYGYDSTILPNFLYIKEHLDNSKSLETYLDSSKSLEKQELSENQINSVVNKANVFYLQSDGTVTDKDGDIIGVY
jgi:hypothetical protein